MEGAASDVEGLQSDILHNRTFSFICGKTGSGRIGDHSRSLPETAKLHIFGLRSEILFSEWLSDFWNEGGANFRAWPNAKRKRVGFIEDLTPWTT
jgi:hypothetical protein